MGFFESVSSCFGKYATLSGRASRSEYWFFQLFSIILIMLTAGLAFLVLFLPLFAVTARRLHDLDRSAWWMLLPLIPLVGSIIIFIWYCSKGTIGGNRFGPDPLADIFRAHLGGGMPVREQTEQLAKIKGLLDSGAITLAEFNRMKSEILAS